MDELKLTPERMQSEPVPTIKEAQATSKIKWETPKLEDVSEQVMAQPYIRFT
jgi:hypothetical protein